MYFGVFHCFNLFVAHSTGGIVTQYALADLTDSEISQKYQNLSKKLTTILLISTPLQKPVIKFDQYDMMNNIWNKIHNFWSSSESESENGGFFLIVYTESIAKKNYKGCYGAETCTVVCVSSTCTLVLIKFFKFCKILELSKPPTLKKRRFRLLS